MLREWCLIVPPLPLRLGPGKSPLSRQISTYSPLYTLPPLQFSPPELCSFSEGRLNGETFPRYFSRPF
jgi:hypothetical protein